MKPAAELADFRNFLFLCWKGLGLPNPTPVQYDIAAYLQNGPKRGIVQAYRGVGKSWITSAYVLWWLYHRPADNILVISASKTRADDFTTFTLRLINELPWLQHLAPKGEQRNSKIAFDVGPAPASHAPSVRSVGITGQITGSRADLIVADDIEVANNSWTPGMREKLLEAVKEFDAVLKPGDRSKVVFLGTPQSAESVYATLQQRGYLARIWPARIPTQKQVRGYGERLAPFVMALGREVGEPVDPDRFSDLDLAERELSYGRSGFALQFMLDTSLSDTERYPLKLSDLIVDDLDATHGYEKLVFGSSQYWPIETLGFSGDRYHKPFERVGSATKYDGTVLAIDPSGRGKDELGYAVVAKLAHQFFLLDAGGIRGGYGPENLTKLAQVAARWKPNEIIHESNFGDGMWAELFKPVLKSVYPCTLTEVRHSQQKELRIIQTLEPVLNSHRLIADRKLVERDLAEVRTESEMGVEQRLKYSLFYQLSHITTDRGSLPHDDRLEAVSMGVAYWIEKIGLSVDDAIEARRNAALEREMEIHLRTQVDGRMQQRASQSVWWQGNGISAFTKPLA
jgi:hypothetical protein